VYCHPGAWTNETSPEPVSDSFEYENQTRNEAILFKQLDANDICAVVPRRNWVAGYTFDMYSDYSLESQTFTVTNTDGQTTFPYSYGFIKPFSSELVKVYKNGVVLNASQYNISQTSIILLSPAILGDVIKVEFYDKVAFSGATALENAEFYCLTDDFNVYKCLFNNNDSPSSIKPTGTSTIPIKLGDGYIWKYMYTIPLSVRNKFLTATTMPVVTALSNQFYSSGSILSYSIENPGKKYPITSYKVTGFRIIDGGSGYNSVPTITLSNPDQNGGVPATVATVTINSGQITAISVNNQGSGYSYPPIVTISGGTPSRQATIEPIIARLGNVYTTLSVSGDGYLEENPYQVDSIEVINGGSGYASVTLLFTDPDLPNGIKAVAQATTNNGAVTAITVTNPGYGYSKPFYSLFQDSNASNIVLVEAANVSGQNATGLTFRVNTKKNEAELIPLINSNGEIEAIQILKPGIGYTYATVTVNTSLDPEDDADFEQASIILNFGIGDIESRQSTVELTAVEGAIHVIKVNNPGFGYTSPPSVVITGDGTGCTATAYLTTTGSIDRIEVDTIGSGYTRASVSIIGPSASAANASAIISPKGGHGKDAVGELYSRTIVFHGNLSKEKNQGFVSTNDYRQVCIVKNPKIFNKQNNLRLALASTCFVAIGTSGQSGFSSIQLDDILTWTDTSVVPNKAYTFRVIEKNATYSDTESALLLSYLDNKIPPSGATFSKTGVIFSSTSLILPDVNKFSGDLLTIDNRLKFSPSAQQIVVVTNSITF